MNNDRFSDCENCSRFILDTETQEYYCEAPLDEDEMARLIMSPNGKCPYFDFYDEYKIVRKQN